VNATPCGMKLNMGKLSLSGHNFVNVCVMSWMTKFCWTTLLTGALLSLLKLIFQWRVVIRHEIAVEHTNMVPTDTSGYN